MNKKINSVLHKPSSRLELAPGERNSTTNYVRIVMIQKRIHRLNKSDGNRNLTGRSFAAP